MTAYRGGIGVKPPLLLIVCVGNMCRSPMAEAILCKLLAYNGVESEVISRGLAAPVGRRPHPFAIAVAAEHRTPISASKHAARLTSFEVKIATVIIVMEEAHRKVIVQKYPFAVDKTFRLDHWCPSGDIADPVRSPKLAFDAVWKELHVHCTLWVDAFGAGVSPYRKDDARPARHSAKGFFRLVSRLGRLT